MGADVDMKELSFPLVENFISINGEGTRAGELAAFLRLKGCNLSCNYCDTSWANEAGCPAQQWTIPEILAWLRQQGVVNVTLTGGEPLLTKNVEYLINALGENGFIVEIETNGSVPLKAFSKLVYRPIFTMDYKCPGSGMEEKMNLDNFAILDRRDTVKFVVSNEEDLKKAKEISERYHLEQRCHIYLSPVFGRIDPKDMVEFMIKEGWNKARLQLQLHKFIWPPEQRGV